MFWRPFWDTSHPAYVYTLTGTHTGGADWLAGQCLRVRFSNFMVMYSSHWMKCLVHFFCISTSLQQQWGVVDKNKREFGPQSTNPSWLPQWTIFFQKCATIAIYWKLFNNQYFGSHDFAQFWTKIVHYLFPRSLERDPRLSQRLDRLKHWRPPLCFTYLRPRWHIEATATSLSGICWNLGWRSMLFSLAVLFTGSRFFAIIAEYQNEF